MEHHTTTTFFILPEGAVQEEPRTWEEIEALAGAGLLAPDTLIFFPEENDWRKACETELAPFFANDNPIMQEDPGQLAVLEAQYEELRGEIPRSRDWNLRIQAADLAIKLGEREAAVGHLNDALIANPFHPRIAQEANRLLSPAERSQLRFFERLDPVWDDLLSMAIYPIRRGPIPLLISAAVLFGLSWVPGGAVIAALLLFVWVVAVTRSAAARDARPPSWLSFIANPVVTLIRPVAVAGVTALELYGPFVAVTGLLVVAGASNDGVFTLIAKSPVIAITMFIATLICLPAVVILTANSEVSVKRIADPRSIVAAIGRMEREYLISAGIMLALFILWLIVGAIFGKLPVVGEVVSAAVGAYVAMAMGFVLSRLHGRFGDHFSGRPAA